MSLIYPSEAARETTRLGIEAAFFWTATAFLAGGALGAILPNVVAGFPVPWIAVGGCVVLFLLAYAVRRWPRIPAVAAVLVVLFSAATVGAVGWDLGAGGASQTFVLGCALIAATAIGSNADRWTGAVGTLVGFLLAQVALLLVPDAGTPHIAALIIAVAVSAYYAFLTLARRAARSATQSLDVAALANVTEAERRTLQQRSRALVHDTVLSDLVALGLTRPGPLSPATRESIVHSLEAVRGPMHARTGTPVRDVGLDEVVARATAAGLDVVISGDPGALHRLDAGTRAALLHAVDQALRNVRRHAGVDEAEVSVVVSGSTLVATVVDGGVGFVEADIAPDRFGFRESIRGRLEAVGGQARILSSPGAGTSILLTVPLDDAVAEEQQ